MDASPATDGRQRARGPEANRTVTTTLPSSPVSSRLAREVARDVLAGPEDQRVALVVTELVTNSVKHAGASPELTLEWDGQTLRIEVFDEGDGRPVLRPADVTSTSGRGLALVDAVSDRWGVEERNGGKAVWAELDLAAAEAEPERTQTVGENPSSGGTPSGGGV